MKCDLYKTLSETNRINKELTDKKEIEISLKKDSLIDNFNITLKYFSDYENYNYCYIEKFNRYYFINKQIVFRNDILIFSLSIDVLMSFKTDILNLKVHINKSDDNINNYSNDINYTNDVRTKEKIIEFQNDLFTDKEMNVLIGV